MCVREIGKGAWGEIRRERGEIRGGKKRSYLVAELAFDPQSLLIRFGDRSQLLERRLRRAHHPTIVLRHRPAKRPLVVLPQDARHRVARLLISRDLPLAAGTHGGGEDEGVRGEVLCKGREHGEVAVGRLGRGAVLGKHLSRDWGVRAQGTGRSTGRV